MLKIPFLQDAAESIFFQIPVGEMLGKPACGLLLSQRPAAGSINDRNAIAGFQCIERAWNCIWMGPGVIFILIIRSLDVFVTRFDQQGFPAALRHFLTLCKNRARSWITVVIRSVSVLRSESAGTPCLPRCNRRFQRLFLGCGDPVGKPAEIERVFLSRVHQNNWFGNLPGDTVPVLLTINRPVGGAADWSFNSSIISHLTLKDDTILRHLYLLISLRSNGLGEVLRIQPCFYLSPTRPKVASSPAPWIVPFLNAVLLFETSPIPSHNVYIRQTHSRWEVSKTDILALHYSSLGNCAVVQGSVWWVGPHPSVRPVFDARSPGVSTRSLRIEVAFLLSSWPKTRALSDWVVRGVLIHSYNGISWCEQNIKVWRCSPKPCRAFSFNFSLSKPVWRQTSTVPFIFHRPKVLAVRAADEWIARNLCPIHVLFRSRSLLWSSPVWRPIKDSSLALLGNLFGHVQVPTFSITPVWPCQQWSSFPPIITLIPRWVFYCCSCFSLPSS